jgi:hypothetical protein
MSVPHSDVNNIFKKPSQKKPLQKKYLDHPNENSAAALAIFGPLISPIVKALTTAPKLTRACAK